jgi:FkbM family methyltransferase
MLRQNIAVNQVQNVEIHESAISSASGHLTLSMPDGQPGHVAAGAMEDPGACSVVARTLDEMVSRLGLTSVAACKIDVEGHELSVFEGATDVLRRGMINAFVFERLLMDGNADPVISLLRQAEYEVYRIYKRPLSFRFCSLTRSTDGIATDDYVALLKSSAAHQRVASLIT